ncbi:MAG: PepSY domain-containing protein [Candidatus Woesearchaeota archaeon]
MKVKEITQLVEDSEEFKSWRTDNESDYLAHVFIMYDGDTLMDRQVGYYNETKGTMSSFTISDSKVTLIPEAEVLKKPDGSTVKGLGSTDVKIDFEEADEIARRLLKEKYSKNASKKIYILQRLDGKQLWNITFLTGDYNTLNIRVDAENGDVVKDELVNIIDFQKSG